MVNMKVNYCKCGCNSIVTNDERKRGRLYVHGHNRRGKANYWKRKEIVKKKEHIMKEQKR